MKNLIQEACQGPVRDAVKQHGSGVASLRAEDLRPVVLRDFQVCRGVRGWVGGWVWRELVCVGVWVGGWVGLEEMSSCRVWVAREGIVELGDCWLVTW